VTGVGTPVSDLFERALLNPHLVQVVAGEEMGQELSTFRMKMGLKEEKPTFWREGAADDLVLGLSIALRLAERQNGGISGVIYVGRSEFGNGLMF
jgi:hypothetical protein